MSTLSVLKIQTPIQAVIANAVKAVAATANVALDVKEISVTEVVKISPYIIMPVLTTEVGNLAGLSAVKSVESGCSSFSGRCPFVKAQIDQYLQVVPLIVEQVVAFKALEAGKSSDNDKINALIKLVQLVKPINDALVHNTFLLGNTYTVADVVLAVALRDAFELYFGPKKRTELTALTRWFNTVSGQKAILKTLGAAVVQAKDVHLMPDLTNLAAAKPEKKKDDLIAALPRSPMSLDAIKKLYGLDRPFNPAFPVDLWPEFDFDGWQLFEVEFKYPEDFPLEKKLYMAENSVTFFAQRADTVKRNVFCVLNTYEKDGHFHTKGAAIIRSTPAIDAGREIPYALSELGDADEFSWTVCDSKTEEGKANFLKFFCATDETFGTPVLVRTHVK